MADTDIDIGQAMGGPGVSTDVGDGSQSADGQGTDGPFLHTWKSKEDAEKGVADLLGQLNETRSKADRASSRNEQLQKVVDKLTDTVSGKQTQDQEAETREQLKQLAKRIDDGELSGQEQVELLMEIRRQATEEAKLNASQQSEALKHEIEQLKAEQAKRFAELDPRYQSHREKIDEVQSELGVDRETAIKIVSKYEGPSQPARPNAPGSTGMGIPTGGGADSVDQRTAALVAGLAAAATGRKPSDAQVKKVMQKGAR